MRFIAHCDSENIGSYKVMEKLGMSFVSCSEGRKNKASDEERCPMTFIIIKQQILNPTFCHLMTAQDWKL